MSNAKPEEWTAVQVACRLRGHVWSRPQWINAHNERTCASCGHVQIEVQMASPTGPRMVWIDLLPPQGVPNV